MADVRVENEVKLWSDGGPLSHDGTSPEMAMERLREALRRCGLDFDGYRVRRFTDSYYSDAGGVLADASAAARVRREGGTSTATLKKPYVRNGLGLSRREFEAEVREGEDPMAVLGSLAARYAGATDASWVEMLDVDVVRCEASVRTSVRGYKLSFDRFRFRRPGEASGTPPNYEIELESIDAAIRDDPQISKLVAVLEDRCLFEEQRMSKLRRGIEQLGLRNGLYGSRPWRGRWRRSAAIVRDAYSPVGRGTARSCALWRRPSRSP